MRLTMSYFEFRQGESNDYSRSYMSEIQRSMDSKEPLSGGASRHDQAMNGVNIGPRKEAIREQVLGQPLAVGAGTKPDAWIGTFQLAF